MTFNSGDPLRRYRMKRCYPNGQLKPLKKRLTTMQKVRRLARMLERSGK